VATTQEAVQISAIVPNRSRALTSIAARALTSRQCPFPCLDSSYGSLSPLPKWGTVPWNSPVNVRNLTAPEESRNTTPRVAVN
jgi:hypothetical protein